MTEVPFRAAAVYFDTVDEISGAGESRFYCRTAIGRIGDPVPPRILRGSP